MAWRLFSGLDIRATCVYNEKMATKSGGKTANSRKKRAKKGRNTRPVEIIAHDRAVIAELKLKHPLATIDSLVELFKEKVGRDLPRSTVHRDLLEIRKAWAMKNDVQYTMYLNRELARLDTLEQEAWDAWRKSQKAEWSEKSIERINPGDYEGARELARKMSAEIWDEVMAETSLSMPRDKIEDLIMDLMPKTMSMAVQNEDMQSLVASKATRIVRESAGNDKFLRLILDIQKDRRKVLGVYAPFWAQVDVKTEVSVKAYSDTWSPEIWDVVDGEIEEGDVVMLGDGS